MTVLEVEVVGSGQLTGLDALGVPVWGAEEDARTTPDGNGAAAAPSGLEVAASSEAPFARLELPRTLDHAWAKARGFTATTGQTVVWTARPGEPVAMVVGLGRRGDRQIGGEAQRWRRVAAGFVRATGGAERVALALPPGLGEGTAQVASAITEGALLAAYRYDDFRTAPPAPTPGRLVLVVADEERRIAAGGVARGRVAAGATAFARDLVNRPPSALTPAVMAEMVEERFAGVTGTTVEVWGEGRIEQERMGGLLGVNRGSAEPPRFLRVRYQPPEGSRAGAVALVGKGITFDSGGLSLKTAEGMTTMKTDMGGAAAVLGALWACATEALAVPVTAYVPLTENMPGGKAIKPGDVLTIRNGATIEVLNTDAEGRLVLADALSLAAEERPSAIVDLATLTGAAVVALGSSIAGLFGNDEALIERVRRAGERAGEPSWPLPLPEEYRDHIDSEVADMKNIGKPGQAGSIAAALLLARFVGPVAWTHLDIAGPARSAEASGYLTKGGTGFGVRTLLELLREAAEGRTPI